jgi:hypothetical protein
MSNSLIEVNPDVFYHLTDVSNECAAKILIKHDKTHTHVKDDGKSNMSSVLYVVSCRVHLRKI